MKFLEKVDAFAKQAGEVLVPSTSRASLRKLAAPLGGIDFPFALECHVANSVGRVDLTIRITPRIRDALLENGIRISDSVSHLLQKWAEEDGLLAAIPYIELEFDIDDQLWDPWIGPAVEPLVARGPISIYRAAQDQPALSKLSEQLSGAVLATLPVPVPNERLLHRLSQAYDALPKMSSINHLGALYARPASPKNAIRLIISLPRYALSDYLDKLDWRGDFGRIGQELEIIRPYAERVDFDLNIESDSAGDSIAFYNEFRAPRRADSYLSGTLEALSRAAYLPQDAKEAVLSFIENCNGNRMRVLTLKLSWKGQSPAILKVYLSQLD